MRTVFEPLEQREDGVVHVVALGKDLFVIQTDNVALAEIEAVEAGRTHGAGDLPCAHVVQRVDHVRLVLFGAHFAVEGEYGGKPLGDVLGRDNVDGAVGDKRFRLFRRQNDVLVVGEHEYMFGVDLLHGGRNIARARVHGLPALDHAVHEQIFEDGGDAFARTDGEHAHLLFLRLALGAHGAVLFEHVLDLHAVQFAQFHRVLQGKPRRVGVHVHFDQFEVADADDAVADVQKFFLQTVDVGERGLHFQVDDEKFGAVRKFDFAQVEVDDIRIVAEHILVRLGRGGDVRHLFGDFFAVEHAQKSAIDAQKAHTARVHDARFFEHGQKFGRLGERLFAALDDVGEKFVEFFIAGRDFHRMFAHHAGNGEHGPFFGFGDGGIGDLSAALHGAGKALDGDLFARLQFRTDAAEQLRKNDARIAPGAFERAFGDGVAQFGEAVGSAKPQFAHGRLDGQRHVRARVAVRHGEDVERVDLRAVYFEHLGAELDHLPEFGAADRFWHGKPSFPWTG